MTWRSTGECSSRTWDTIYRIECRGSLRAVFFIAQNRICMDRLVQIMYVDTGIPCLLCRITIFSEEIGKMEEFLWLRKTRTRNRKQ